MNRLYTLAGLALVAGSLSAQRVTLPERKALPSRMQAHHRPNTHPVAESRDGGTEVFSEDFANGLNGNNNVGEWTVGGVNGNVWKYSNGEPFGAYTGHNGSERIGSATTANGYMIFNSDSANTDWSDTTIVANPVQLVGSLISPVIDLTATPNVLLQFQTRMRYCCRQNPGHYVEVSTDGGNTWPTRINVDVSIPFYVSPRADIQTNDDSGTLTYRVNMVNAILADPSQVSFRFLQEGTDDNALSHYEWQVDDVKILTLPSNDLILADAASYHFDFDVAATFDSLDVSIIPTSQLHDLPLNMTTFNNGAADQPNVVDHFNVEDAGGSSVFSQDVTVGTLAPGQSNLSFTTGFTPPSVVGAYTVTYAASSDSTDIAPSNNSDTTHFQVSNYVYARDDDSRDGEYNNNDENDQPQPFILGNVFHITNAVTIYAVDVAIASGSDEGVTLVAQVRSANRQDVLAESNEYETVAADMCAIGGHNTVSFILTEPLQLEAGGDFWVGLQHFGGADVSVATSGNSPEQTSQIYDTPVDTWFFVTNTPMVRMNFNSGVGISENDVQNGVGLGQNIPNPSTDQTMIPYSLTTNAKVSLEVRDLTGKLVKTIVEGERAAGTYRIQMDTQNLTAGVYTYTLTAGAARMTKRMTVVR